MAATKALVFSSPALLQRSFCSFQTQPNSHINSEFKPFQSSKVNPSKTLFIRTKFSTSFPWGRRFRQECGIKVLAFSRLVDDSFGEDNESGLRNLDTGAAIDLKLPRRRLLVEFTCNQCGERTKRLINRLAYERGLVFVQCGGCLRHHKLVDNLGLIVEYDFREEIDVDSNTDKL